MSHDLKDAYQSYWFLYNHPKSVDVDPDHPLVEPEYEEDRPHYEFVKDADGLNKMVSKMKNRREWSEALKEGRTTMDWSGQFIYNLDIHYAKVNPETRSIEKDQSLNTKIECWLETGPAHWDDSYYHRYIANVHDVDLDSSGDSFDEALINLAQKVKDKYGDYTETSD